MSTVETRVSAKPIRVGHLELPNRMVMTPHLGRLPGSRLLDYYEERAKAGVAMAILPAGQLIYHRSIYPAEVSYGLGRANANMDEIPYRRDDERFAGSYGMDFHNEVSLLAATVQRHGTVAIGQVHLPGPEQSWETFEPTIAPTAMRGEDTGRIPHELTESEISGLIVDYAAAAAAIIGAGMDGVELHSAHGYMLNRFLSPRYNRRTDRYGGSRENRRAFVFELIDQIRDLVGEHAIIGIRMPGPEDGENGLTQDEIVEHAGALSSRVSYINISLGNHSGLRSGRPSIPYISPWLVEENLIGSTAAAIRAAVDVPVLLTGRITTPEQVESFLSEGVADLIGAARAYIADPKFAQHVLTDNTRDLNRCIGSNECAVAPMSCPVNPDAGRERQHVSKRVDSPRSILVIGAGPAGTEFAIRNAQRGNRVTVLDEAEHVGGALTNLVKTEVLSAWRPMLDRLRTRARNAPFEFHGGIRATIEHIEGIAPDAVVFATGSQPLVPDFPTDRRYFNSLEVFSGEITLAPGPVMVVGGREGHLEPLLTVLSLLKFDPDLSITLITENRSIGSEIEARTLGMVLGAVHRGQVRIEPMQRVVEWSEGYLSIEHLYSSKVTTLPAENLILAHGRRSLIPDLQVLPTSLTSYTIGDALAPRRLTHAVLEGARFGLTL